MTTAQEIREVITVLELREAQAVGKPYTFLEGRAVPYGVPETVGWFREQHAQDSFKQSTRVGSGKRAPLLLFHDNKSFPIGHAEEWSHNGGLNGVWRLNDSPEAQRAAKAAENGDLVGMSVGFQPIHSDWSPPEERGTDWAPELGPEHMDLVTRLESRLIEVSLTPTPAYSDAAVTLVRSALAEGARHNEALTRAAVARPTSEADAWRDVVDALRCADSD
jgi:hypothetical protein